MAHAAVAHDRAPTNKRKQLRIAPGTRIGRYVVERRLGAGGMGVVYLAHDPDLERRVAIKIVRPGLTTGRTRLLREGQAVAKLIHPNVVSVFDVGALGEDFFIAMEYVPGANLDEWLRGARRPWREVLHIFLAAGRGLGAAHRAGLVHRDFKPDNVLIGDDGRVVVSDFGLVRSDGPPSGDAIVDDELELTRTAGMVGTPAYMSPEQFLQAPVDSRSDQFSFCVALWLGLFGVRPFERADSKTINVEQMAQAVLRGQIQLPPRDRRVPSSIVRALRRGLSVDPEGRFATMDDLLLALRPPDRRPLIIGAAAGAVTLAAAVIAATRSPERPAAMAVPPSACEGEGARVAAIWNPRARAAYLAGPGEVALTTDDVAWFDETARRWTATARAVCKRPRDAEAARSTACLGESLAALQRALGRRDRAFWPELPDPRACAAASTPSQRELRMELGNIEPSGAIAPDGSRLAFAAGAELQAMMNADGESQRADLISQVTRIYGWSADGRHLTARAGDAVVRIDVETSARTVMPWTGDIVAVARDGAVAARRDTEVIAFLDRDGRDLGRIPLDRRVNLTAVDIEPGGRRAAMVFDDDGWFLVIGDVTTGRFVRHRLRVHGDAGASLSLLWSGPGRVVLGGSSRRGDDEGLWTIELDDAGAFAGPPAMLLPPRANTIMDLIAVEGQRALVVMVDIPNHVIRHRDGRGARVPGLLDGTVWAADAERDRFLLRGRDGERLRVFGADGTSIAEGSESRGFPVLYDGNLWFARNDGGDVLLTSGDPARPDVRFDGKIPAPLDRVRCSSASPRRCFVSWFPEGRDAGVRHALIQGGRVRRAFDVPVRERDLDLAYDGRRALVHTEHEILEYDIRRKKTRVLYREPTCEVDESVWSPDATSIYFVIQCGTKAEIRTMAAKDGAKVRTLVSLDSLVSGIEALGEDDIVYSTIDYESRLVVVDGLALLP